MVCQVAPPSLVRKIPSAPAKTRSGSSGLTASALSYQSWLPGGSRGDRELIPGSGAVGGFPDSEQLPEVICGRVLNSSIERGGIGGCHCDADPAHIGSRNRVCAGTVRYFPRQSRVGGFVDTVARVPSGAAERRIRVGGSDRIERHAGSRSERTARLNQDPRPGGGTIHGAPHPGLGGAEKNLPVRRVDCESSDLGTQKWSHDVPPISTGIGRFQNGLRRSSYPEQNSLRRFRHRRCWDWTDPVLSLR